MNKVYTKQGDQGTTELIGGSVSKDDLRVQAYGDIDEADCALGFARSLCKHEPVSRMILDIQNKLKLVMAETASVQSGNWLSDGQQIVIWMENRIDEMSEKLRPLEQLIVPGGKNGAPALHMARAVVRRAERSAVALKRRAELDANVIVFLNRLSDLCFTMARFEDEYSN